MRHSSMAFAAVALGLSFQIGSPALAQDAFLPEGPPIPGSNVQLGTDTDVVSISLDREASNGYLFATLLRSNGDVRILRSTDGGASWVSTTSETADIVDLDSVVAGDWLYAIAASDDEALVVRASSTTGARDTTYAGDGVLDLLQVVGQTVQEVAIVSNEDTGGDAVWCFALASDHKIYAFSGSASTGVFSPVAGTATDAREGLAAAWNIGYPADTPSGRLLLYSYVATNNEIHSIRRHDSGVWQGSNLTFTGSIMAEEISISAYHDHVFVVVETSDGSGDQNAEYSSSSDGGYGWSNNFTTLFTADTTGGSYYHPLVSLRSGTGAAFALLQEKGATDTISLRDRHNWSGAWSAAVVLNDEGAAVADTRRGNDFDYLGSGWALGYVDELGQAWFTWAGPIFYSGLECGDEDEWSSCVGAP